MKITKKEEIIGWSLFNSAMSPAFMFFDFPTRRPRTYILHLENGREVKVTESQFNYVKEGDDIVDKLGLYYR